MSDNRNTHADTGLRDPEALPYETASQAELLSSSHLFTVQLDWLDSTSWSMGEDNLEHRQVQFHFRVLEVYKGALRFRAGESFELDVNQERENELFVNDYHGFWSHAEVEAGAQYLVLSRGAGDDPETIMREPSIQALMDAGYATDVAEAQADEKQFGSLIRTEEDPKRRCDFARQLLRRAYDERVTCRGPFGRYVWARVAPVFNYADEDFMKDIFRVVRADDATLELRESLLYGLYEGVLSLGSTRERTESFLRQALQLLLEPNAAPIYDRLIQVPLYNLVFRPDAAPIPSEEIVPDSRERDQMRSIVSGFTSPKAQELVGWFEAK